MIIPFYKFHGTGNDFVIIDNRSAKFEDDGKIVSYLCDRRFGIGADGLILLNTSTGFDFEMVYYNSDGNVGTMCGNGGRCIVALAHRLGIIDTRAKFKATDGAHIAVIKDISKLDIVVNLKMKDVSHFEDQGDHFIIDTGSPHYVKFVHNLALLDVYNEGKTIRHSSKFITNGINVNFVEVQNENIFVRTFERGVENETLSCGTGIIASVLAHSIKNKIKRSPFPVRTLGGNLNIYFKRGRSNFYDIWIEGPAVLVYKGQIRY